MASANIVERVSLCVLGAGIAGLNALAAAREYLKPGERAILIDRRDRAGGMWVSTYPYVRLHQPHRLFTAGDIAWKPRRNPSHLASRTEVLDHFDHCLAELKRNMDLTEYYGWEYESHTEHADVVTVTCRSAEGRSLTIEASRLINAFGHQIAINDPLPLSSDRVRSASPDKWDMSTEHTDAPVWIVGGGKTAMDTAHTLVTDFPGREVNLIAGKGTAFASRDAFFPRGLGRLFRGMSFNAFASEAAMAYDGTDDLSYQRFWTDRFTVQVTPTTERFLIGVLSEAEAATIRRGANEVLMDYLDDVLDRGNDVVLKFRSGAERSVPPGSVVVNCTGYLRRKELPYQPYLSHAGRVLTITNRSGVLPFSAWSGYLLTHLFLLDRLRELPLYELDSVTLTMRDRNAASAALAALTGYNMGVILKALPPKALLGWGGDPDRFYPRLRSTIWFVKLARGARQRASHNRRTLDTLKQRFPDVRCGQLEY